MDRTKVLTVPCVKSGKAPYDSNLPLCNDGRARRASRMFVAFCMLWREASAVLSFFKRRLGGWNMSDAAASSPWRHVLISISKTGAYLMTSVEYTYQRG